MFNNIQFSMKKYLKLAGHSTTCIRFIMNICKYVVFNKVNTDFLTLIAVAALAILQWWGLTCTY